MCDLTILSPTFAQATLIVVLAGNDTFGTSKYDVYALNELSLGGGMGSSALASAMGSLALNKKGTPFRPFMTHAPGQEWGSSLC